MVNGEPIASIDNSLKDMYSSSTLNKFDGFGDYASIVASLPSSGGTISPAGVYYSNENNFLCRSQEEPRFFQNFPITLLLTLLIPNTGANLTTNIIQSVPDAEKFLRLCKKKSQVKIRLNGK